MYYKTSEIIPHIFNHIKHQKIIKHNHLLPKYFCLLFHIYTDFNHIIFVMLFEDL